MVSVHRNGEKMWEDGAGEMELGPPDRKWTAEPVKITGMLEPGSTDTEVKRERGPCSQDGRKNCSTPPKTS